MGTELDGATATDYVGVLDDGSRRVGDGGDRTARAELVATPLLEETQLGAEQAVILQEIADAEENPAARADDLLGAALFAGHRLATSILGEAADVRRISGDRIRASVSANGVPLAG